MELEVYAYLYPNPQKLVNQNQISSSRNLKYPEVKIVDANLKHTPELVTVMVAILRYAGSVGLDF